MFLELLELVEGERAGIAAAPGNHVVGYVLGIRHRLPARGGIALVVEHEVVEVISASTISGLSLAFWIWVMGKSPPRRRPVHVVRGGFPGAQLSLSERPG